MSESGQSKVYDVIGITILLLSICFCVLGIARLQSNTEDILQWLPDDSPARVEFDEFREKFGADDFLIVTWTDCTTDDPRLPDFTRRLIERDSDNYVESIVHGAQIIDELTLNGRLTKRSIEKRFKGIFFGVEDTDQTMAIVELSKEGSAHRKKSLEVVKSAIEETPDLAIENVTFGGAPYVGIRFDLQMKNSFTFFVIPSVILASLVALYCLRDIYLSIIVCITAGTAAACSVAIVPVLGLKFSGLMSIIPALVFILATSGSIHLVHYSLEAIGDSRRLLSIGWKPCFISTLTTAVGMLSLARSSFPAVRNFGYFCATGAVFALLFQLLIVPWLLSRIGKAGQMKLAQRGSKGRFWTRVGLQVQKQKWLLAVSGVALMLLATAGLFRLTASVDVKELFDPRSHLMVSLTELETRMGPLNQSQFLVEFKDVGAEEFHRRVKLISVIQRKLNAMPQVSTSCSVVNYLPREPSGKKLSSFVKRRVYQRKIDEYRDQLADSHFLSIDGAAETWRISLRFPFTEQMDFENLKVSALTTAKQALNDSLSREEFSGLSSPIHLAYTGTTHLYHRAQEKLLEDLFWNFFLAFVIITPVLILVLRSLSLGLIAMLPNLFPIVVFFGLVGWVDWPIDLALAMTACVALGIAVDDTTHFLIRFREFGGRLESEGAGRNVLAPLRKTISQCGPAMLQTTLIGCSGMCVYFFSEMVVVRHFSTAIFLMLVMALVADILMLPALVLLLHGKQSKSER